jgi:hypothetical protein
MYSRRCIHGKYCALCDVGDRTGRPRIDPRQEQGSMYEASSGLLPAGVASWVLPYCISLRSISTLSSLLRLGLRSGFALSGYFTRTVRVSLRPPSASCSAHFILRDLMTPIILYLAWNTYLELLYASSQSSCSFLLGPRIFLCLLFSNISPRVLLVTWETEFRTHTAQHANFNFFLNVSCVQATLENRCIFTAERLGWVQQYIQPERACFPHQPASK